MEKVKKITELDIDTVKVSKTSHRFDDSITGIENSLQTYGFQQPIIVDKDYNIVAGNAVYTAAKNLGYTKIPCVVLSDLTDEQIKEYRIADNKTSEFASWNEQKLKQELSYLSNPTEMQPFFDENITRMIGFSETPSFSANNQQETPQKVKLESSNPNQPTAKIYVEQSKESIEKEINDFRNNLRYVEDNMAAKKSNYFSYNCSKCQRKVTIALNY